MLFGFSSQNDARENTGCKTFKQYWSHLPWSHGHSYSRGTYVMYVTLLLTFCFSRAKEKTRNRNYRESLRKNCYMHLVTIALHFSIQYYLTSFQMLIVIAITEKKIAKFLQFAFTLQTSREVTREVIQILLRCGIFHGKFLASF